MRVLVVDDKPDDDKAVVNVKKWIGEGFPDSAVRVERHPRFRPKIILDFNPDVVILDVALTDADEDYLNRVSQRSARLDVKKSVTGIEYCRDLKSSFASIPVILTSRFFHQNLMTIAFEAGADGFLHKRALSKNRLVEALRAIFFKAKTDDIAFYEALRDLLEDPASNAWKREHMLLAMDAFFTRGSASRRLAGLWSTLSELVENILPAEAIGELLRTLMDSEALLLAANPTRRDHVRHSGNVFWLGYYLLNRLPGFRDPSKLTGFNKNAYEGSNETVFDQLNSAWLLASLLHDVGYLGEKIQDIYARVNRGCSMLGLPAGAPARQHVSTSPKLDALKTYMEKMGSPAQRVYSMMLTTLENWGQSVNGSVVNDHGLISASAFLACVQKASKKVPKRPEILHAAVAMAAHNLPRWNNDWPDGAGTVEIPVGLLPAAWLLAYCDELQAWGREPETDPFALENPKSWQEARAKFRQAFVKGSRIASFNVADSDNPALGAKMEISIQHMMNHGKDADDVAMALRTDILHWKTDRVDSLRKTLGLDGLFDATVIHWIPAPISEPIVIQLNGATTS